MEHDQQEKHAVVRITRMTENYPSKGYGKRRKSEPSGWVVYGVGEDGVERVYVEHSTDEEHQAWRASDPLLQEAQRAIIRKLLADPGTRDTVLQINIKAALDMEDEDTAVALARQLSPEALERLTRLVEAAGECREPTNDE